MHQRTRKTKICYRMIFEKKMIKVLIHHIQLVTMQNLRKVLKTSCSNLESFCVNKISTIEEEIELVFLLNVFTIFDKRRCK